MGVILPVVAQGVVNLELHVAPQDVDAGALHIPIEHFHDYLLDWGKTSTNIDISRTKEEFGYWKKGQCHCHG